MTVDLVKEQKQDQRAAIVKLVRKWGDLNTDAVLDPHCSQFFIPSIELDDSDRFLRELGRDPVFMLKGELPQVCHLVLTGHSHRRAKLVANEQRPQL